MILKGLKTLKDNEILHGDLKRDNILIDDRNNQIKAVISDLG